MATRKYDYWKAVERDIRSFIRENIDLYEFRGRGCDLTEYLVDELDEDTDVTGGYMGYETSAEKAEENLCHNLDLLVLAADFLKEDMAELVSDGALSCDTVIRKYVLREIAEDIAEGLCAKYEEEAA